MNLTTLPHQVVRLARMAVQLEAGIWHSLFRWVARRPAVPAGAEVFTYHKMPTPVIWLWIFASAAEIPAVHFLIPWEGVRIALLVGGVWGVLWMIGMLASLKVFPHLVEDDRLRIRNGFAHDVHVPWDAVARVGTREKDLPSTVWAIQPEETEDGTVLNVGVSGRTNVEVSLREPTTVRSGKGEHVVTALRFWADEPRAIAARAREHAAA